MSLISDHFPCYFIQPSAITIVLSVSKFLHFGLHSVFKYNSQACLTQLASSVQSSSKLLRLITDHGHCCLSVLNQCGHVTWTSVSLGISSCVKVHYNDVRMIAASPGHDWLYPCFNGAREVCLCMYIHVFVCVCMRVHTDAHASFMLKMHIFAALHIVTCNVQYRIYFHLVLLNSVSQKL